MEENQTIKQVQRFEELKRSLQQDIREMKLLIQFPTRGRGQHGWREKANGAHNFFEVLDLYYARATSLENVSFSIVCNKDDKTMNNSDSLKKLKDYPNLEYCFLENETKIEACNHNLKNQDFDIVLLASDDQIPQGYGYDNIVKASMAAHFPTTDGALWFFDGTRKESAALCTLSIMGKRYFERFGYIYHPSYKSFFSDDEYTKVALKLNKIKFIDHNIITHIHPTVSIQKHHHQLPEIHARMSGGLSDETYTRNMKFYDQDKENFLKRKQNNFELI